MHRPHRYQRERTFITFRSGLGIGSRAGCAWLLGTLVACGGQSSEVRDSGDPAILPDAALPQLEDAGHTDGGRRDDAGAAARVRFSVSVPGVMESVPASLASMDSDRMRVDGYPELVHTTLRRGTLPVSFEGAFSEAFCAEVEELATLASEGGALGEIARQRVLSDGALIAHLSLYPFLGPPFETAAREAVRAAGASAGSLTIENALVLEQASIDIELKDDAITHHIGEVASLEESMNAELTARRGPAFHNGTLQLSLSAKDLWCDLAQDRAHLVVRILGNVAKAPFVAETRTSGVDAS
jgi:hypothetical protein